VVQNKLLLLQLLFGVQFPRVPAAKSQVQLRFDAACLRKVSARPGAASRACVVNLSKTAVS
jgi:hypothetical protein